jgi:hypothetical protein
VAPFKIRDLALPESRLVPSIVVVNTHGVCHGLFFFTRVQRGAEEDCARDASDSIESDIHEGIKIDKSA